MSDTNNDNPTDNPFIAANADLPNKEIKTNDCYWDRDEMNVLQDAYFILRDAGYTAEEIRPLGKLLTNTTIYTATGTEMVYKEFVEPE